MLNTIPYSNWPLHIKFFSKDAVMAWESAARVYPALPRGFTCSVEVEGVDGKRGVGGGGGEGIGSVGGGSAGIGVEGSGSGRMGGIDLHDGECTRGGDKERCFLMMIMTGFGSRFHRSAFSYRFYPQSVEGSNRMYRLWGWNRIQQSRGCLLPPPPTLSPLHHANCKSISNETPPQQDPLTIALCPTPTCHALSHLTCLATHFLTQELRSCAIIPRGGDCSGCREWVLWGDVVRGADRRKFGGPGTGTGTMRNGEGEGGDVDGDGEEDRMDLDIPEVSDTITITPPPPPPPTSTPHLIHSAVTLFPDKTKTKTQA